MIYVFCVLLYDIDKPNHTFYNKHMRSGNTKSFSIKPYFAQYKGIVALYIFLHAISTVGCILGTLYLAQFLELITLTQYASAFRLLCIVLSIDVSLILIDYLASFIHVKYLAKISYQMSFDITKQAFKLNSETYAKHNTGTFIQRIVSEPTSVVTQLSSLLSLFFSTLFSVVIMIYISILNWFFAVCIVVFFTLNFIINKFRLQLLEKNFKLAQKKRDNMTALTTEIIKSEKDIKNLGLENKLDTTSQKNYHDYYHQRFKTSFINASFMQANNLLYTIFNFAVLALGMYLLDLGILTFAAYMLVYSKNSQINSLTQNINYFGKTYVELKTNLQRVKELFDEKEFQTEKFGTTELQRIKGKIEFKNIYYAYKEKSSTEKPFVKKKKNKNKTMQNEVATTNNITTKEPNYVLKNLSFTIQPNTTVAFVGKSGSGKTTILNLLSKMYDAQQGEVLLDDVNIQTLSKQTIRNAISFVNQFPYIFDMTVKDNLLLVKPDATNDELWNALEKSSLKEYVQSLPNQLDTMVGESGIKLSGGQRQRLAIARAFLRNSPILIFDESTSSLDNFAQNDIKTSIDALKGSSTIVIVAHRLSTIRDVDVIYFLENGTIIDQGTFAELFKRNKLFKQMFYAENLDEK